MLNCDIRWKQLASIHNAIKGRDENNWLILEGRGRMKIAILSEKSFIRPVNLLYLPN